MQLRPELQFPPLDEEKVQRLARIAGRLDGSLREHSDEDLALFNREAGTSLEWLEFQGIYGACEHDVWVREVLARPFERPIPDITREELLELIRRICNGEGEEHETSFYFELLAANVPDPRISDLIYWPGEYFGDGDNQRELTPEQILDTAQAYRSDLA
jgi:hypothetical protein